MSINNNIPQKAQQNKVRPTKWIHFDDVVRDPAISPAAKALFAILVSYSDQNGICWPSIKVLMNHMGYSNYGIRKLLNELISKGAITKTRRGKKLTNVYIVNATSVAFTTLSECNSSCTQKKVSATPVASECNCGITKNTPPAYCPNGYSEPNSPINRYNNNYLNIKEANASTTENPKEIDTRVQPVLKKFYQTFKEFIGVEPTKTAFDWGHAGKKIKELPENYTTTLLIECIEKFFHAPGFIRKNYTFNDFLLALPRLLIDDYGPKVKPNKPSNDFSSIDFSSFLWRSDGLDEEDEEETNQISQ